MSEVFLSYRQTDDAQKQRVRAFGEQLRASGINVILDQFFEDDYPAGPNEGWPQWSSNRASKSDYVLIVGTEPWFRCFEGTQQPGVGLGGACEARIVRQRLYDDSGVIDDIRIVLFDDADAASIPIDLRGYHRFHTDRDFEKIVRWLGGKLIVNTPRTSIPHNLPSLQPFFGREEELKKIADALDPESRTWGALIDGPGGMGKTSLAVRAAYDAPANAFEKIAFVSLKPRELDDDGVRDLSGFIISGLAELFNELARELDHAEITKATEDQRPRLLLDVLRGTRTLLVLDNLESLIKRERDVVFTFVKKLPAGCKAILTSRGRIGSGAEELILEKLSERAALDTLAKLAENNSALAKTSEIERVNLYRETGGNPLLLRWTSGQIGRGSCLTSADAIIYLRACPAGNDPLEFIFGDLVDDFTETEMRVLCALTYFTMLAKVEHIANVAECSPADADYALRSLTNRSLVVPSEELKAFTLVPLVADFLKMKKLEHIVGTGDRLEKHAYSLIVENGYTKYDRFPILDDAWPTVAAALSRLVAGSNEQLQRVCYALTSFLDFTGRWDERLALSRDAEARAIAVKDFRNAGRRACDAGFIYYVRNQSKEVFACADRAEAHWRQTLGDNRHRAEVIWLRGLGYKLLRDYKAAAVSFREVVDVWRSLESKSDSVARGLNSLAGVEHASGDLDAAERNYAEALQIAQANHDNVGIAIFTSNLAEVALDRQDWPRAEVMAREALRLSGEVGRLELIAETCKWLATALERQGKQSEAFPYADRAVKIYTRLRSPLLAKALETYANCQS
jgi:tetratricopeptide (TPR) repeat protein